jgi:hypothetical protein
VKPTIDDLHDYVLDLLPNAERRKIDAELARSPELAAEVRAVREALTKTTAVAGLTKPRPEARNRLLSALSTGDRYAPFMRDLARDFDLSLERVRELCGQIDQPSAWEAGPLPGIAVMHFPGGPNAIAPDTGFVRLPRGLAFPYHRHVGHEINYVMEGAVRDGDGSLYLPGEAIVMTPGTEHEFSIPGDSDALIAVVQAGFDFVPKPG